MAGQDARRSSLELADELVRATRNVVGADVVAQILHGSLASSDFVLGKSDVDLLVIVRTQLGDEQKSRLGDAVTALARPRGVWLDYRVVTSESALHPQEVPTLDFSVGIHPGLPDGVEIEQGPVDEPDLLYEFSICREAGRSLVGDAPAQLIGPVPNAWLLALGDAYLKRWQEIDYDGRVAELMVFTACRLWYRHAEGGHITKSDAARWAMRQAPELVAPGRALARRTGNADAVIPQADVMTLLAAVRAVLAGRD